MPEVDMGEFSSVDTARDELRKNPPRTTDYVTAWWGDKEAESGHLSNRGYGIGFADVTTSAGHRSFRRPHAIAATGSRLA